MTARFFESDFQLPALDKPSHNGSRGRRRIGAGQSNRLILLLRIAQQDPADRQGWFAIVKPDGRRGGQLQCVCLTVMPGQRHRCPNRLQIGQHLGGVGNRSPLCVVIPCRYTAGPHKAACNRRRVTRGRGKDCTAVRESSAALAAVPDHHPALSRQPALQQLEHADSAPAVAWGCVVAASRFKRAYVIRRLF